ncbi:hypothetical protein VNO78_16765 [Psophocarpus tetragonolobus]|uniref:Uncharacterized protein n=1 Tax=Psophocarpus tetragonolobus TaxID=3891 RepID=A0AAN9SH84_PSOTE
MQPSRQASPPSNQERPRQPNHLDGQIYNLATNLSAFHLGKVGLSKILDLRHNGGNLQRFTVSSYHHNNCLCASSLPNCNR